MQQRPSSEPVAPARVWLRWYLLIPSLLIVLGLGLVLSAWIVRRQGLAAFDAALAHAAALGIPTTPEAYHATLPEVNANAYDRWAAWFQRIESIPTHEDLEDDEHLFSTGLEYEAFRTWRREPLGAPCATAAAISATWAVLIGEFQERVRSDGPPQWWVGAVMKRHDASSYFRFRQPYMTGHALKKIARGSINCMMTQSMPPRAESEHVQLTPSSTRGLSIIDSLMLISCIGIEENAQLACLWAGASASRHWVEKAPPALGAHTICDPSMELAMHMSRLVRDNPNPALRGPMGLWSKATLVAPWSWLGDSAGSWCQNLWTDVNWWTWAGHDASRAMELCWIPMILGQSPPLHTAESAGQHLGTHAFAAFDSFRFVDGQVRKARISHAVTRAAATVISVARRSATMPTVAELRLPVDPLVPVVYTQIAPDRMRVHVDWPMPATAPLFANNPESWERFKNEFDPIIKPSRRLDNVSHYGWIDIAWPLPPEIQPPEIQPPEKRPTPAATTAANLGASSPQPSE